MAALDVLTDTNFEAETRAGGAPLLVDFWAPWCGSCRLLMPTVTKLADELEGRLRVAKLDVDAHPELAQRLDVMSVPTLILFKDGEQVTRISGMTGRNALLAALTPHLDQAPA